MPSSLHILAPGLTARMAGVDRLSPAHSQATLERFLSRADQERVPGRGLESTLCHLFGVEQGANGDCPVAALRRASGKQTRDGRFWLQAEPVCLRPDQTRLLLFDTWEFDVSREELESLRDLFITHFEPENWIVEADDPFCWYVSPNSSAAISSYSLGDAFGRNMDMFLPQGRDRLHWHRLLNEVQMLFFGSEVNRLREAAGKMPIGGLWFSGFGCLPEQTISSSFQHIFGDDALTAGLARLSATPLSNASTLADELVGKAGASLVIYPDLQRPVWRADPYDWLEKLGSFCAWLEARIDGLLRGRVDELLLYPCDGRLFRMSRQHRYRLWRGTKPLPAWLLAEN